MDPFCYLCFTFVFIMLFCLFLAALRLPAGKGLAPVMFSCVFVTPIWCLGYLIVSIPDLCLLPYLENSADPDERPHYAHA